MKINKTLERFNKNIRLNEKLSKYSWFNLGGAAEIFFKPTNEEQLVNFLKTAKKQNLNLSIIGAGSNILFRDGGIKGVTIKLGTEFSFIKKINDNEIEAGASTLDKKLAFFAAENNISGFEFLSCIPGSVGGAVVMNSGCYGNEISKILLSINCCDFNGNIKKISRDDLQFHYRGSNLPENLIILSAKFKGKVDKKEIIKKKQDEMVTKKKQDQPTRVKTCGSTFKNPDNKKAWKLIRESNSHRFIVGDAKISDTHTNFFINAGNAKSRDIEDLIKKVQKNVFDKCGVNLDLEIKIIGEKEN